jgi:FkbM family methyltransferase
MSNKEHYIVTDPSGNRYSVGCPNYRITIGWGRHTPHTGELDINKDYINTHKRNGVCIDVGGHIGTHAVPYSKLFDEVYTFEANKDNYDRLVKNIGLNNRTNITAYNKAVSDKKRRAFVKQMGTQNTGQFAVIDDPNASLETVTIDEFQIENVDFIKIDVEGRELDVVRGAFETISRYKPLLQIEFNDESAKFGISNEDTVDYILSLGYMIHKKINMDIFFIDTKEYLDVE